MEEENTILNAINELNLKMENGFADVKSEIVNIKNTIEVIPEMQKEIRKISKSVAGSRTWKEIRGFI